MDHIPAFCSPDCTCRAFTVDLVRRSRCSVRVGVHLSRDMSIVGTAVASPTLCSLH